MFYAISSIDKPEHAAVRQQNRPAHLDYLRAHADAVRLAGPYTNAAGDAMTGSLIVVEAMDLAAAQTFADNDPYARAGLFASVEIRPWRWVIGNPDA